jgi:hypothetical protein
MQAGFSVGLGSWGTQAHVGLTPCGLLVVGLLALLFQLARWAAAEGLLGVLWSLAAGSPSGASEAPSFSAWGTPGGAK